MKKRLLFTFLVAGIFFSISSHSQITSVTPTSGVQGEKLDIVVTVENMDFNQGTNLINLVHTYKEYRPDKISINNSKQATISYLFNKDFPTGNYSISVNNLSGTSYSKEDVFTLSEDPTPAVIDSISLYSAKQDETFSITFYGTNTNFNELGVQNTAWLSIPGNYKKAEAQKITVINNTELKADFNIDYSFTSGMYEVYLSNKVDGTMVLSKLFNLEAGPRQPKIVSVSPNSTSQGQNLDIQVTTKNITLSQGTSYVYLQNNSQEITPNKSSFINDSISTFNFSFNKDNPIGNYDLYINNYDSNIGLVKYSAINLTSATSIGEIISISNTSGKQGEKITIQVNCKNTNLDNINNQSKIWLENNSATIYATTYKIIDQQTIQAEFDLDYSHKTGNYNLILKNNMDGKLKASELFTINKGDIDVGIASITPNTAFVDESLDIEITTNGVDLSQGSNIVTLKQNFFELFQKSSHSWENTKVTASFTIPKSMPTGNYDISIYNTESHITLVKESGFTIQGKTSPNVEVTSRDSSANGEYLTVELSSGEIDFTQGSNTIEISQNDTKIIPEFVVVTNKNTISIKILFDSNSPMGTYDISVTNSGSNQTIEAKDAISRKSTATGVPSTNQPSEISIYPNPAFNNLYIDGVFEKAFLYNITGKLVLESDKNIINIQKFPKGIYFIKITNQQNTITKKVIKK